MNKQGKKINQRMKIMIRRRDARYKRKMIQTLSELNQLNRKKK